MPYRTRRIRNDCGFNISTDIVDRRDGHVVFVITEHFFSKGVIFLSNPSRRNSVSYRPTSIGAGHFQRKSAESITVSPSMRSRDDQLLPVVYCDAFSDTGNGFTPRVCISVQNIMIIMKIMTGTKRKYRFQRTFASRR